MLQARNFIAVQGLPALTVAYYSTGANGKRQEGF